MNEKETDSKFLTEFENEYGTGAVYSETITREEYLRRQDGKKRKVYHHKNSGRVW